MPYIRKTTKIKNRIYRSHVYSARYGDKTIPAKKVKPTRDAVKRVHDRERIQKLNWLIELNFEAGDWSVTLTFRRENRTSDKKELQKIKKDFLKELRKLYKKSGTDFKYILVVEKLKTCVHIHMLINNIPDIGKHVQSIWNFGRVYMSPMYDSENGFEQLASYLLKESTSGNREKGEMNYTRSRNLDTPKTKVEVMPARKWKDEPSPPKGYYLVKDSLITGVNHWGYMYQAYVFEKIPERGEKNRGTFRKL